MMTLTLVTPPALEPVDLIEAKAHLRVDGAQDDALISALIATACAYAQQYTRRSFLSQTLRLQLDQVPGRVVTLPGGPVQSVSHVKVYAADDSATVVGADDYQLDGVGARLALREGAVWPQCGRALQGFEVQYVAGYGAAPQDVPAPLRQGILAHIAHLYTHRGDRQSREGVSETLSAQPYEAMALYAPYRLLPGIA